MRFSLKGECQLLDTAPTHLHRILLRPEQMIKRLSYNRLPLYPASVSMYESGKREPPLPVLLRYARLAGVCLDRLVDDELYLPAKLPSRPKHKG